MLPSSFGMLRMRGSSAASASITRLVPSTLGPRASTISHDGLGVYAGLPADIEVGRYHSLAALTVPAELAVTSHTADGEVMGVRHHELPVEGVQFHPESVLTPLGPAMAKNFLDRA